MATDPYAAMASPMASDDPYASLGEPVDAAPDAPTAPKEDYNEGLSKRIAAGVPLRSLQLYLRQQGVDPGQVRNLEAAVDYRDRGGKQPIQVGSFGAAPEASVGRSLGLGVGDIAQGVGDTLGLVANPLNTALNMTGLPQKLTGAPLGTDLGQTLRDAIGAPAPVTDGERLVSAIDRGGAGGLASAGVGALASGAAGVAGTVARSLAANPVRDLISGLSGGAGAEVGSRVGGTPGAIVGGLAGGFAGAGAARLGERAAEAIATRLPRSVIADEAGALTEEGREIAARAGADPEELVRHLARVRESTGPTPSRRISGERRIEALPPRDVAPAPASDAPPPPDLDRRSAVIVAGFPEAPVAPPPSAAPFDEAASEGIQLTRGQAEKDFDVYNDEQGLKVSATREGNTARQFFANQAEQVKSAVERFRSAFGDADATPADRGTALRQAVSDMRDHGADGVRQLYRNAEELGGDQLHLKTDGIHNAAMDVLTDEAVPEGIKRPIEQELARYGIIGKASPMDERGFTTVELDRGAPITFRGPVKTLSASNADDMRKAINRLYDPMRPNTSGQAIKPAIDDALEGALERAAGTDQAGIGNAYTAARDAYRTQRQTFHAKDIIESLHASKSGTDTPVLLPEKGIAQTIGQGPKAISNLRQVKTLLLSSQQPSARHGWEAIKQQSLADIFGGATTRNTNIGGEVTDAISGAKLRTMIHDKYGIAKLRTILEPEEFNQLMKLERIIGNATIPITGTTNPSGTATKVINYMRQGVLRMSGIPGLGHGADVIAALAGKARDLAATRKTLEGITSYDGRLATGRSMDARAREFMRQYIDDGQAGRLVPTGINLSASQQRER